MSFTTPLTPFPSSSPNPPTNNNNPDNNTSLANSASLYLYTFLATLVLLLGVSSAIVTRSFILRRRHRRLVEEAIRNGTWIPPSTSRDGSVNPGAKPNMFEAFVSGEKGPLEHRKPNESAYGHGKEDVDWDAIMPFSATYMSPFQNETTPFPPPLPTHQHPSPPLTTRLRSLLPIRHQAAASPLPLSAVLPLTTTSASPEPSMQPETPPPPTPSTLRVAVLIAMPSPALHGHHESAGSCSGEQESIPHVEFGVVDVCVGESAGGERQKRSSEESGVSEV